jgi:hypothetical protein
MRASEMDESKNLRNLTCPKFGYVYHKASGKSFECYNYTTLIYNNYVTRNGNCRATGLDKLLTQRGPTVGEKTAP